MIEVAAGSRLRRARASSDRSTVRALHVLLVDDDTEVCEVIAAQLRALGCTVIAAGSGNLALHIAHDYCTPIDVLLTDVEMPGMTGPELVLRMQSIRPETMVVLMSGGSARAANSHQATTSGRVLAKPFSKEALEHRLLEIR
jgi:CheY-like chemotaxis protein